MRLLDGDDELIELVVSGINFSVNLASDFASLNLVINDGSLLLMASTRYLTIAC